MERSGQRAAGSNQLTLFTEPDETLHLPLSLSYLTDLWHQSFIVQGYDNKKDADRARKKGEVLMQRFFEWWQKEQREVLVIEKGFSIEVDIDIIKGRFDRIERTNDKVVIIDYKTGGLRTQEEVDDDLQLSIYALACEEILGQKCDDLVLLFLHEDGITEVHTSRTDAQLSKARSVIGSVSECIDDEKFEPTPSESACKRCPYRGVCSASVV